MVENETVFLICETTESQRKKNHNRLPDKFWLVLFPGAATDKPYAIVAEWNDGLIEEVGGEELNQATIEFWMQAKRRIGDW
jgi:hypothetical protein